ncbi:NAD-dependent epimerase/dehydratase family protein [Butyribacter intestini]|uniref:NAD-dependent epimerase/dehydratase family protein n=1 Tax=Butyribacter intestini TaxID=1703332 RepID=UPI003AF19300
MKILVLGSTGFIGKNIFEYLKSRGYDVYAPNHSKIDALDEKSVLEVFDKVHYDIVLNALDRNGNDKNYFENRLRMFQNLAMHNDLYGKMIYFGSGAEYGRELPIHNIEESEIDRVIPKDTYGFCLQQMNDYARKSENIYNFRLFGIFGKYELWNQRFISNAICKAMNGYPITIRQDRYMDYLYIDDLCKIVEWAINNTPKFHDYNAVSGKVYSLYELAETVNHVMHTDVPIYVAKDGYFAEYTANNNRILNEITDFEIENIEVSIDQLAKWYMNNKEKIDREKLLYQ